MDTSFKLTCCKYIDLKENTLSLFSKSLYTVSRSSTLPRIFLMGRSGWLTIGENFGGSTSKPKSLKFPLLFDFTPTKKLSSLLLWLHYIYREKKVSLTAFRQILSKILPEACIFSNTIMTYLKKFIATKSLDAKVPSRIISQNYTPLSS